MDWVSRERRCGSVCPREARMSSAPEGLIVQKYGGTSVGSPERIRASAARVAEAAATGQPLIVVVSAMGHTTDELIHLAHQVTEHPNERELDLLLSTGEMITAAL